MNVIQVPRRFVRKHWGGTESVILESSRRLIGAGHRTRILCPSILSDISSETIEGIPVTRSPYFYPYWGLKKESVEQLDYKAGNLFSFDLMSQLKECPDVDLIHLHTGKRLGGIVRRVACRRRIPYVITLHGGVYDVPTEEEASWTEPTRGAWEWGKALGWWVGSRRVLRDAAAIICVGETEYERTRERYPRKQVVHLPNGVDYQRFSNGDGITFRKRHGLPLDARIILTVGRIDSQKNQLSAVELMRSVAKESPDIHLVLLGHVTDPSYCNKLLHVVRKLSLEGRVHIIPGVDAASQDLVDAYHAADMFLLTSRHEPFGIVVLEAWAAGLPVIASNIGGLASLIDHNVTGVLVRPDDQQSVVEAVTHLLSNPQQAADLASSAKQLVAQKYDWGHITHQLIDVYQSAITQAGRNA